jgi:hypothetical protein
MGLGPSAGFSAFVEVKRLFSTTLEEKFISKSSWIETEANGGHWGDRTQSWHDRMRSVSSSHVLRTRAPVRPVTHETNAFGQAVEGQRT